MIPFIMIKELEFSRGVTQPKPSYPKYLKKIPARRSMSFIDFSLSLSQKNLFCQVNRVKIWII